MSDLEKAKTLLAILSTQEVKLKGAREAFSFTQSYTWLLELTKKMEQEQKNGN